MKKPEENLQAYNGENYKSLSFNIFSFIIIDCTLTDLQIDIVESLTETCRQNQTTSVTELQLRRRTCLIHLVKVLAWFLLCRNATLRLLRVGTLTPLLMMRSMPSLRCQHFKHTGCVLRQHLSKLLLTRHRILPEEGVIQSAVCCQAFGRVQSQ